MAFHPTTIGKYRVESVVGRGGMGVVYKAVDSQIGRYVAIKMILSDGDQNLLERFRSEARSTGSLRCPNIVTVYDFGEQDGNPYLVMQYLEGESLESMFQKGKQLTFSERLGVVIDVCNGLAYAHQRGIIHRDIKPANIMVLQDGVNDGMAVIVDFGIARIGGSTRLTKTDQIIGSVHFMSPEQLQAKELDNRTDIYAIGVVLYQLLTGSLPFDAGDTAATLLKIIHEAPRPLSTFVKDYPPELEGIVSRAIAKDREDRYSSAQDLAFDLEQVQKQLKSETVLQLIARAEDYVARDELTKAREQLQQALRVDRQNSQAHKLIVSLDERMRQRQQMEQAKALRAQADAAYASRRYDDALALLDQAANLNPKSADIQTFRESVQAAKQQAITLRLILRRAESALQNGNFEGAEDALAEAFAIDPQDAQAKALKVSVTRQVEKKMRQEQFRQLLDQAHGQITARNFSGALATLKTAEALDPSSAELQNLTRLALAAQEQEKRRIDIEALYSQIEAALQREDVAFASDKVDEGLRRFPQEQRLLRLKALIDAQRHLVERKSFINQQLAAANELAGQGRTSQAIALLERALQQAPGDSELESLRGMLRYKLAAEDAQRRKRQLMEATVVESISELASPTPTRPPEPEPERESNLSATVLFDPGKIRESRPTAEFSDFPEEVVQQPPRDVAPVQRRTGPSGAQRALQSATNLLASFGKSLSALLSSLTQSLQRLRKQRKQEKPAVPGTAPVAMPRVGEKDVAVSAPAAKRPFVSKTILLWSAVGVTSILLIVAIAMLLSHQAADRRQHAAVPLNIQISPDGARVRINDQDRGSGSLQLSLTPGEYRVEVSLPEYRTFTNSITVKPQTPAALNVTLEPWPQVVRITTPDLETGEVWLDDNSAGKLASGNLTLPALTNGQHTLKIATPGRAKEDAKIAFQIAPGAIPAVNLPLETHQLQVVLVSTKQGIARVVSSLPTASVEVDGTGRGELNAGIADISDLSPGIHELGLGQGTDVRKMSFEIGQGPALDAIVYSDRAVGSVLVLTEEDGAQVSVDGHPQPRKTQHGQLRILSLAVGPHTIGVTKDGFTEPPKQKVTTVKGQEAKLQFPLVAALPQMAGLIVEKAPAGVEVSLDDTVIGKIGADGTLSHSGIRPGEHSLSFKLAGFQEHKITKKFVAGETLRLEVPLKPITATLEVLVGDDTVVTVMRGGQTIHQSNGRTKVSLDEGSYFVTTHNSNSADVSREVKLAAGESKTLDLRRVVDRTMDQWSGKWTQDGQWYTRHGGGVVLYNAPQATGNIMFTTEIPRGRSLFSKHRISWVASFVDDKNYLVFQLDDKFFYRASVVNGNKHDYPKVALSFPGNAQYINISIQVSPTHLLQRYNTGNNAWQNLNDWDQTATPSPEPQKLRSFSDGKFGFDVGSNDTIELSNFSFESAVRQ